MGSFAFGYAASPVIVPPSQHPPEPVHHVMESNRTSFSAPFSSDFASNSAPTSSFHTPSTPTSFSSAGRKRSRDEAALGLQDEYFPTQLPPPVINEEEWEYGEGMTLIKPSVNGLVISAGSQTGTWAEEKEEEEKATAAAALAAERPILRSAKSQRLDLTSTPSIVEEPSSNGGTVTTSISESPAASLSEPTIDDYTRYLGIGWSLISSDEDIQAAARGWARYISNHFPVSNVNIRLQSRGLASYLVEATEGYFLFGEDLKQGQLVSRTLEQTFANLQGPVPVFEGETVMSAVETPKANDSTPPMSNGTPVDVQFYAGSDAMSQATSVPEGISEVDMDMS